jgi:indole-3-glycerol phosphate synthase
VSQAVSSVLDTIVAATRRSLAVRKAAVAPHVLAAQAAASRQPEGDRFRSNLASAGPSIIAECKRRSPSKGVLRANYAPVSIAAGYERAGAAAISVLTEPAFFDGDLAHLAAVRAAVGVPLLRKDFTVDAYQLDEAILAGADAVLLIVAALDDDVLRDLHEQAGMRGLAALVEVHGEHELDRALALGARIIGVNNRNLRTLAVDVGASLRMVDRIPGDVIAVAESGLRTAVDVATLARAGYDGFLVGERFMTADDPGQALASLITAARELLAGERA